ncbi:hypothetical protein NE865_07290 [Phthorimaea operculella]|nr:hypothetical protein NE865_07290 [Phthorimaea operculella]
MLGLLLEVLVLTSFVKSEAKNFVSLDAVMSNSTLPETTTASISVLPKNASTPANIWIGYIAPKKSRRFDFDRYRYCLSFKKCEECMSAALFACTWCHHFGCTHRSDLFCPEVKHSRMDSNDSCPAVVQKGPVRKHIGTITITLKIRTPDPIIYQHGVVCKVVLGDKQIFVRGYITNNNVNCERFEYHDKNNLAGHVQLIWGGPAPVSREVPLVLYSCDAMGKSCSACKEIKSEFDCGWCAGQEKCTLWSRCRVRSDKWAAGKHLSCDKVNGTNHHPALSH